MNVTRREFVKFLAACALVGAGAIGWDSGVNGGRPAESGGEDDEPPQ